VDREVCVCGGGDLKSGQESIGASFRGGPEGGGQPYRCVGNLQAMTEKGEIFKN
jgi:hypothetical protein